jgi:hypothetical protein
MSTGRLGTAGDGFASLLGAPLVVEVRRIPLDDGTSRTVSQMNALMQALHRPVTLTLAVVIVAVFLAMQQRQMGYGSVG